MKIRNKLTYQFIAIVAIILSLFSLSIYYFSKTYRIEDYYSRLRNRASNIANILIDVEEIDTELLAKIEKDNPASLPNEKIIVYSFNNEELFNTDYEHVFTISPKLINDIRLYGEVRFKDKDYEMLGFLFTSKYDRFVVVTGAQDIYGLQKMANLRTILIIAFSISIVLVFIAGRIYAGRALLPMSRVVKQVNNITANSMDLRVEEGNGKDEIATLASTFNQMLNRLEVAFNMQKNFIANASHELRTPLTAITGQLEVLLLQDRTTEHYKQTVYSVLDDLKNLNQISNRLLLLAQASSETSEAAFSQQRIDEILWQSRAELLKRSEGYKIQIAFEKDLSENKLVVMGNKQLLKTAITNLMDNGCKYSADRTVSVYLYAEEEAVFLSFKDNGIGIPYADREDIFQPFHRGKNAESVKGHGIGLSLVQKIITLHHGYLKFHSQVNKGTQFIISLPVFNFN